MKRYGAFLLMGSLILSACSTPNLPTVQSEGENPATGGTMENNTTENDFGYASLATNPDDHHGEMNGKEYKLDRQVTADAISRFGSAVHGVESITTVVTDEEVLISYQIAEDADIDRNETADQIKRNALSVIPRWFHVYVTDDPSLRVNVENLAQTHLSKKDMETAISATIEMMKESSPQGYPVGDGENKNGETKDEEISNTIMKENEIDLAPAAMDIGRKKTADA